MTTILHFPPQPDAPIACDMTTAVDTPDERLQTYQRLFERGLLRRERRAGAVALVFRADERPTVEELARREAACCPFVDHRVELQGDELIWTITNPGNDHPAVDATLDAFHDLPDHAGSDLDGLFGRLAERGVHVVEVGEGRYELGDSAASPS